MAVIEAKFGPHVSKLGEDLHVRIDNIASEFPSIGSVQIFITVNQSFTPMNINKDEIKKVIKKHNLNLYVHSSYTTVAVFNSKLANHQKAKDTIFRELDECGELGARGLVIHLPKMAPTGIIDIVVALLKEYKKTVKTPILLEHRGIHVDPKKAELFYNTPESIISLCDLIRKNGMGNAIKICIDTSHLWCMDVDITEYNVTYNWFNKLRKVTAEGFIELIHFNSNKNPKGGKDNHAVLLDGVIWKDYKVDINSKTFPTVIKKSGLYAVFNYCRENGISMIFERDNFQDDILLLEKLNKL
jgi:endonuclease IV